MNHHLLSCFLVISLVFVFPDTAKAVPQTILSALNAPVDLSWSYLGDAGPSFWGRLPGASLCDEGKTQSPIAVQTDSINISAKSGISLVFAPSELVFAWQKAPLLVINTGQTIKIPSSTESYVRFKKKRYNLKQFHFHSPSEHLFNERQFSLEVHFVHVSADSETLVIAAFFEEGPENPELDKIFSVAPAFPVLVKVPEIFVLPDVLLPDKKSYYSYPGSLTTPPCTEGVKWLIFDNPVPASTTQIRKMETLFRGPTNRNLQPLNGRSIDGPYGP